MLLVCCIDAHECVANVLLMCCICFATAGSNSTWTHTRPHLIDFAQDETRHLGMNEQPRGHTTIPPSQNQPSQPLACARTSVCVCVCVRVGGWVEQGWRRVPGDLSIQPPSRSLYAVNLKIPLPHLVALLVSHLPQRVTHLPPPSYVSTIIRITPTRA